MATPRWFNLAAEVRRERRWSTRPSVVARRITTRTGKYVSTQSVAYHLNGKKKKH